jgi:HK97 family phage portal protein
MHLIDPRVITPVPDADQRVKAYKITINSKVRYLSPAEILHIMEFSPTSPYIGAGAGEALQNTLYLEQCANQYNMNGFEQDGAHGRIVLETDKVLGRPVAMRMLQRFKQKFTGKKKSHEPILNEGGLKAKLLSTSLKDMEYTSLRKMNREETAAAVGTPPSMIGILEFANYSNMDAQERIFWESEVLPLVRLIEHSLTTFLLNRFGEGLFVKFDLSGIGILQEPLADWMAIARDLIDKRLASPNEVRALMIGQEPEPPAPAETDAEKFFEKALEDASIGGTKRAHARYLNGLERKFLPELNGMLADFQKRVIAGLARQKNGSGYLTKVDTPELLQMLLEALELMTEDAKKKALRFHAATIAKRGKEALAELGISESVDMVSETVQLYLKQKSFAFGDNWPTTVHDRLRSSLLDGLNNGESINALQDRVRTITGFERKRALLVARTEATPAFNFANHVAYKQSGVVERKRWLTANDEVVRATHSRAQGEGAIDLDARFQSTNLLYPGDPSGDVGEIANCRCTDTPVLSKENANATTTPRTTEVGDIQQG